MATYGNNTIPTPHRPASRRSVLRVSFEQCVTLEAHPGQQTRLSGHVVKGIWRLDTSSSLLDSWRQNRQEDFSHLLRLLFRGAVIVPHTHTYFNAIISLFSGISKLSHPHKSWLGCLRGCVGVSTATVGCFTWFVVQFDKVLSLPWMWNLLDSCSDASGLTLTHALDSGFVGV